MHAWISSLNRRLFQPQHPVIQLGDPRLRERAREVAGDDISTVTGDIGRLTNSLYWFRARYGSGHGIAAPQIGIPRRIVLVVRDGGPVAMINPRITWRCGNSRLVWERCMSFPHLAVRVPRPTCLSVTFHDRQGNVQVWRDPGPDLSALVQHEVDHLDGILTIDRAADSASVVPWDVYRRKGML